MTAERIKYLLKHMSYDAITDRQHDLVVSFEEQFERRGALSDKQTDILESIFKQAEDRADKPWWEMK